MLREKVRVSREKERILILDWTLKCGVSFRRLLHDVRNMAAYDSLHAGVNSEIEGRRDMMRSKKRD